MQLLFFYIYWKEVKVEKTSLQFVKNYEAKFKK